MRRPEAVGNALPVPISAFGPLDSLTDQLYEMVLGGRCAEALALTDRIEPGVRGFGDTITTAFVVQARMYALIGLGRFQEAEAVGLELLRTHREAGNDVAEAKISADLAEVRIRLGRIDEGLRDLAWASALLERCKPFGHRYVSAVSSVGEAARAAELYELADQSARVGLASGLFAGNDLLAVEVQRAELLLEWGMRLEHLGYAEDARSRFVRAEELTRGAVDRMVADEDDKAGLARALHALALAKIGEPARAAEIAVDLVVAARQSEQFHEARLAHLAYGVALRDLGDLPAARRELLAGRELASMSNSRAMPLLFDYELASLAASQHGAAAADILVALRNHAGRLWHTRLERITMLRQARARAELEAERARADEAACRDPLTGLGNRRRFEQQMSALGLPSDIHPPVTLALVDADSFKAVNDDHSHAVGDAVLRQIAEILRLNCREDDVAVRFGGDEFAVFFTADLDTASQIAERVRRAVAERDWTDVAEGISVTLSIGLAEFRPGMSPRELFDVADHQLYAAKHGGRNRLAAAA